MPDSSHSVLLQMTCNYSCDAISRRVPHQEGTPRKELEDVPGILIWTASRNWC